MRAVQAAVAALVALAAAGAAADEAARFVKPDELKWADVPSLPAGAKLTVIEGALNQAVPFTVRIKFPANYRLPPHHHPAVERVTVLSGTFHLGLGEAFERDKAQPLGTGAMAILQPGTPHYAWTSGETVVQLHGTGPWGVSYRNPADDPRKP